ncbi:enhanced intracellular survival protein Eis [Mycolicibacterium vinylchloridicum]|uniref:enhanced intracellular survival protein Eis n=1 Tax=Mycolicibacterium vinylchloridicum TaxID=2736928 RepID=UPI0015CBE0A1|nr:enhanced intracellular survival protein Eis [Mycolicibacterium vinylchloridicum]
MRQPLAYDNVDRVVDAIPLPEGITLRSARDDDWPAMRRLAATCFGSFRDPDTLTTWRSMSPREGVILGCDGTDIVGMCMLLDLELTVPGGRQLPTAGVTWVAVAPTHRRRGLLRAMFTGLHQRIVQAQYPIAGLLASEATIYGRFGYGPATTETALSIERRHARLHPEVPTIGGVRVVDPAEHRDHLADIWERWRRRTPGGLRTPPQLWDEVLADRASARHGGSPLFCLLHDDGFVMYRTHDAEAGKSVEVTKFTAVTGDARLALWQTLLGLDLMHTITVGTHPADPLPHLLADPRQACTVSSEDALWLRIVDVPMVLAARRYSHDVSTVIEVSDAEFHGGGRYALIIRDGQARCVPSDESPEVRLDLSVLGSIYLGAHRPSAFAAVHRLHCDKPDLLRHLDLAFSWEAPAELGFGF